MSESELIAQTEKTFEDIKHVDENGNEYWYARELQTALQYSEWRKFEGVIEKAKEACQNSNINVFDHFIGADKMVGIGSGAHRCQKDYVLSRYACYLIAQNGDARKRTIALAQTYFAVKTRQQEITEEQYKKLTEDEKDYGKFNNAGYKGVYNGETAEDIAKRKGLKQDQQILDYMGSSELGANIFRITQTDELLKNNKVNTENEACNTHNRVGKAVRETIKKLGGTMPENLPTPEKSTKEIEEENKNNLLESKR